MGEVLVLLDDPSLSFYPQHTNAIDIIPYYGMITCKMFKYYCKSLVFQPSPPKKKKKKSSMNAKGENCTTSLFITLPFVAYNDGKVCN